MITSFEKVAIPFVAVVAIVANDFGLAAGTAVPGGPTVRERIPQGHKIALSDIGKGMPVRRYDGAIVAAINMGAHVDRVSSAEMVERFLPRLQEAAASVKSMLV